MKLAVKTLDGADAGSVSVADEVFGLEPRADILHRMVRYQLAKRRAGTHAVKNRADVTGSTKKFESRRAPAAPVTAIRKRLSSAVVAGPLVLSFVTMQRRFPKRFGPWR